ncbi:MAG: hypothetical protein FWC71_08210 [Defluviitaleaceae bacterium]|nr:hypothetical protein [Defluviitaleaceae bacterium]
MKFTISCVLLALLVNVLPMAPADVEEAPYASVGMQAMSLRIFPLDDEVEDN